MQLNGRELARSGSIAVAAVLLALFASVALAACGGSGSSAGKSKTKSGSGTAGSGFSAISTKARECLKEHGVELPSGGGAGAAAGGKRGSPPYAGQSAAGKPPKGGFAKGGKAPTFAHGGATSSKMEKAFKACGVKFTGFAAGGKAPGGKGFKPPNGSGTPPSGTLNTKSAAFRSQIEKYVACMRENGYDMPKPNLSGTGTVFKSSEVDRDSAKYKKASAACASDLRGIGAGQ